jgi:hypothetical protein
MGLPDADDQATIGEDPAVCVPQRVGLGRFRCDRPRLRARPVDAIETAVLEAGAEDDISFAEPGSASILVYTRPDVEVRRHDVDGLAAERFVNQRGTPLLIGATLGPVDAVLADVDIAKLDSALGRREL